MPRLSSSTKAMPITESCSFHWKDLDVDITVTYMPNMTQDIVYELCEDLV